MAFLQAGFGDFLGAALLGELRGLGWQGIRLEQGNTVEDTALLTLEVLEAELEALVIVFDPSHVAAVLEQGGEVEIENEPTIAYPDRRYPRSKMTADEYAVFAKECLAAAPPATGRLWLGSVHTLNPDCLAFLKEVVGQMSTTFPFGVSYHRYGCGPSLETPQPGMTSRTEEMSQLLAIADGRLVARTETGRHTAPDSRHYGVFNLRKETWQFSDEDVARDNQAEIDFDAQWGVRFTTIYQLNDGPDPNEGLDRFGIRTTEGLWKPSAYRTPPPETT